MEFLLSSQSDLFSVTTFSAIALVMLWEAFAPYRAVTAARNARWRLNFLLMAIGAVLLMLLVPISMVALAQWARRAGWGLFNLWEMTALASIIVSILIMDLGKYAQHWAMHRVAWLWRVHRVHHCDTDMDVTTSVRFHPFELIFTVLADALIIVLFGCPAIAVLLYRLVRVAVSTFVHGNVTLPESLEKVIRVAIATPDFHRVHHSIQEDDQGRNLSGGLIWWDKLLGTYCAAPRSDPRHIVLGLEEVGIDEAASLKTMMGDPFLRR